VFFANAKPRFTEVERTIRSLHFAIHPVTSWHPSCSFHFSHHDRWSWHYPNG